MIVSCLFSQSDTSRHLPKYFTQWDRIAQLSREFFRPVLLIGEKLVEDVKDRARLFHRDVMRTIDECHIGIR